MHSKKQKDLTQHLSKVKKSEQFKFAEEKKEYLLKVIKEFKKKLLNNGQVNTPKGIRR